MAPRPSRVAGVETGLRLRSRVAQALTVLLKYASCPHLLQPCRKTRLNIR